MDERGVKMKWVKRAEKGDEKERRERGDKRIDDQAPAHKSSKHLLKNDGARRRQVRCPSYENGTSPTNNGRPSNSA
jgi:hypothetical protein